MKKIKRVVVRILKWLELGYKVTKRLLIEIVKWYDIVFFIVLLYGIRKFSALISSLPTDHQDVLRSFIEWYAVFYALALSVILAEAWRRHNQINSDIDREADALKQILQAGKLFQDTKLYNRLV